MLNCKPGDLAVIMRSPASPENIGKIVRVLRPAVEGEKIEGWRVALRPDFPAWIVESAGSDLVWHGFRLANGKRTVSVVKQRAYADYCLKPIRDPGDDAVDETLQPKEESCSI